MKNCKKCGKQNFDEALYCVSCGDPLEEKGLSISKGLTIFLIVFALVMVVVLLKSCGEKRKARLQDATPDKTLCIPSNIQTASEMFFDIAEAYSDDPKNAVNQVSLIKIPKCMEMARYYFMTSLSATTETTMVIQQNNYLEELRRLMKCAPNCD